MTTSLFDPIKIRGLEIANRAWVSPMCQYSATDGVVSAWHPVHIGSFASGGAGLIMMEATGVTPEGRISVACTGLWNEEQVTALKPIVEFAHSQGSKIGIQLAHAGRKGSTMRPWDDHPIASQSEGGWTTVAPSAIAFHGMPEPHALTTSEIADLVNSFGAAAKRAVSAGFDLVEIHSAHGYLLHQFLSPLSNHRTDEYGGDLAGRSKFLLEVAKKVREVIPAEMPLFVRVSATDWKDGGWHIEETVKVARELKLVGVDLIDTSTGGLVHDATIPVAPGFQTPFAQEIKESVGTLTSSVGLITDPHQAEEIISTGKADAVMLAREFLRNPRWPLHAAHVLGKEIEWPKQLQRARLKS